MKTLPPLVKVSGTCSCGYVATALSSDVLRQHMGAHTTYHFWLTQQPKAV